MNPKQVHRVLDEFNVYRAPEAQATLVSMEGDRVTVQISGTACRNCSFEEHAVDLAFYLEDHFGSTFQILKRETTPEGEVVVYERKTS